MVKNVQERPSSAGLFPQFMHEFVRNWQKKALQLGYNAARFVGTEVARVICSSPGYRQFPILDTTLASSLAGNHCGHARNRAAKKFSSLCSRFHMSVMRSHSGERSSNNRFAGKRHSGPQSAPHASSSPSRTPAHAGPGRRHPKFPSPNNFTKRPKRKKAPLFAVRKKKPIGRLEAYSSSVGDPRW